MPPISPSTRNLLIALYVLYAVELGARSIAGLPIDALLTLQPPGAGFAIWQPLTRYLVQGTQVYGVLLSGLGVFFLLPPVEATFSRRQLLQAAGVAALGGTVATMLLSMTGVFVGAAFGWDSLVVGLTVLFGLKQPNATIRLFFVLPVPAKALAWGTGAISFLVLLATRDLGVADTFCTWAAAIGWWFWMGPGGKNRRLKKKARGIERELRVLQGGRNNEDVH